MILWVVENEVMGDSWKWLGQILMTNSHIRNYASVNLLRIAAQTLPGVS